ncbi:MAG TPA: rod shape-determining protein MreD, partial [Myxococcales bacterium]|nr:rod shape-determining protein MreD [Myxococcales bacterium]
MKLRNAIILAVCVGLSVLESVIPFLFHLRAARPDLLLVVVLYLALHDDVVQGAALSAGAGYLSDLTSATPAFLYTFLAVLT